MPKISIVTPTKNCCTTIGSTIESVLSQRFGDFEYILIDGGSSDGSVEVIRQYTHDQRIRLIEEADKGVYYGMNNALKYCSGDWIYFLGGDDILLEGFSHICGLLDDSRSIYYGNVIYRDTIYHGKFSKFGLSKRNAPHQAIFYPRCVFSTYRYDTTYRVCADYKLNIELWGNSYYHKVFIDVVVANFNDSGLSSHGDTVFDADKDIYIREHFGYFIYFIYLVRKLLVK